MRRKIASLSLTAILGLASQGHSQTGDGYVGVFADSAGTIPCATVPPYTGAVLYVYAVTEGVSASGLTGAEFRIEVSHPQGWSLNYMAPSAATTVLGNALDKEPGVTNNKGVNLAFAECQLPVNSRIPLGAISVGNYSGSPTNLTVKRHEKPKNPNFTCPLFTLCDSPAFTSRCMSTATAPPCSSLSPAKPGLTSDDPPVFTLVVNDSLPAPSAVSRTFSDMLTLGPSELWVIGQRVDGPTVNLEFDGSNLLFNSDHELAFPVIQDSPVPPESMAIIDLIQRTRATYVAGTPQDVLAVLHASPIVEEAIAVSGTVFKVKLTSLGGNYMMIRVNEAEPPIPRDPVRQTGEWRARNLVSRIKSRIGALSDEGVMILVSGTGGVRFLGGESRRLAAVQIQHLLAGNPIETMPPGPLRVGDRITTEIIAARGGN